MSTIAEVLMNQNYKILGSNNHKKYLILGYRDKPFHLLIPYQHVPTKILMERYKLDYREDQEASR
jgi:hypothetical protein